MPHPTAPPPGVMLQSCTCRYGSLVPSLNRRSEICDRGSKKCFFFFLFYSSLKRLCFSRFYSRQLSLPSCDAVLLECDKGGRSKREQNDRIALLFESSSIKSGWKIPGVFVFAYMLVSAEANGWMSPLFGPNTCQVVFSVVRCIDPLNPQKKTSRRKY